MLISVIVPLFRGERYISRIISSIETNVEIDASETEIIFVNDDPRDFFEEDCYTSQVNIQFINHKQNKGIHQTKIDGFKKAKGQYLLFLDQDDTIADSYFASQLKKVGEYDAVFCNGFRRQGESIYYPGKMENCRFHLDEYFEIGYPLISLGQMLVRYEAVPKGWTENPMAHNGWDDHLFWICMLHEQAAIQYNSEYLYVHEEAGDNASFDWISMKNSGIEFRDKASGLNIFDEDDNRRFTDTIEKRVAKYDKYIELDDLLNHVRKQDINTYLCINSIQTVAVYGVGVYGKKLCRILDPKKICIKYGIDKNVLNKHAVFPIYENVREDIPVDCIICATGFEDEALKEKITGNVLTMKEILQKADRKQRDMERIYIFGIGKGKEILKECIFRENVEILGYVDNYADKYINKKVDGLRVIKPEDMGSEFDYIVNSLMQYQGIEGQLLDMGIPRSSIINFFSLEDAQNPEYWKVLKRNEWRIETLSHLYQKKVIPYLSNIKYEVAETFRDGEIKLPTMLPAKKAVEKICLEHVSLARFGDGEFELIQMRNRSRFQTADTEFAGRLKEVLQTENEMVLIAIADNYGSLEKYTESAADAIRQYLTPSVRSEHMELLDLSRTYYDAYLSRPYIMYKDKKGAGERFRILKQIWDGQDILIVEGKNARSGVGNDLFQNTRTIQRILAPDKNAYASYRELYEKACAYGKDKLILISLGAAATVLAYDLGAAGYWAVDIGQIDMEYEWFLRGVEERCDIPYKNISEMKDGDIILGLDEEMEQVFKTQIVGVITCEGTKKC